MTEHLLPTTSMTSLSWISKAGFSDHTCNRKCIRIESIKCSWKVILHFLVLQRRWYRQTHTMYDICQGNSKAVYNSSHLSTAHCRLHDRLQETTASRSFSDLQHQQVSFKAMVKLWKFTEKCFLKFYAYLPEKYY